MDDWFVFVRRNVVPHGSLYLLKLMSWQWNSVRALGIGVNSSHSLRSLWYTCTNNTEIQTQYLNISKLIPGFCLDLDGRQHCWFVVWLYGSCFFGLLCLPEHHRWSHRVNSLHPGCRCCLEYPLLQHWTLHTQMTLDLSIRSSLDKNWRPKWQGSILVSIVKSQPNHRFILCWSTHLICRQVTKMQRIIVWDSFDESSVEELTKLRHQTAPLVFLCIIAEEAVQ